MDTPHVQFTEEHLNMLNATGVRLTVLEEHRAECDRLHEAGKEHRKRSDDAMNHLTESNILLAKTITEMNVTMTKITDRLNDGQPVIKFWKGAATTWSFNKRIWLGLVGIASGIIAIAAAWKVLG